MIYVYILKSEISDRFYVGMSENVDKRLREHNSGKVKSTKAFKPWKAFFFESFNTRAEAREQEKFYKSGVGRKIIRDKWNTK